MKQPSIDLPGIPKANDEDELAETLDHIKQKQHPLEDSLDTKNHEETSKELTHRLNQIKNTETNKREDDPLNILPPRNKKEDRRKPL